MGDQPKKARLTDEELERIVGDGFSAKPDLTSREALEVVRACTEKVDSTRVFRAWRARKAELSETPSARDGDRPDEMPAAVRGQLTRLERAVLDEIARVHQEEHRAAEARLNLAAEDHELAVSDLDHALEVALAEAEQARAEAEGAKDRLAAEQSAREVAIRQMQERIDESAAERDALRVQMSEGQAAREELAQALASAQREAAEFKARLKHVRRALHTPEQELSVVRARAAAAESERDLALARAADLADRLPDAIRGALAAAASDGDAANPRSLTARTPKKLKARRTEPLAAPELALEGGEQAASAM